MAVIPRRRGWRSPPLLLAIGLLLARVGQSMVADNIELQWYHDRVAEWQVVNCLNNQGPCISFDLFPGAHRLIAIWIDKGIKGSVQLMNMGESPKPFDVYLRTDKIPTEKQYEYHFSKTDSGFAQRTCRGAYLYIRVQSTHKSKKQKFGVMVSADTCRERDYRLPCPVGWADKGKGYCAPPRGYKGKCTNMNFFGHRDTKGKGADPMSADYRIQWSRFCGEDWPCMDLISQHCMPELRFLDGATWRESRCSHAQTCHQVTLQPERTGGDWELMALDVPSGSAFAIEVRPDDQAQSHQVSANSVFTLSGRAVPPLVDTGDLTETEAWSWDESWKGKIPYIELINHDCKQYKRFYVGVYNNAGMVSSAKITMFKLKKTLVCRENPKYKDSWETTPQDDGGWHPRAQLPKGVPVRRRRLLGGRQRVWGGNETLWGRAFE